MDIKGKFPGDRRAEPLFNLVPTYPSTNKVVYVDPSYAGVGTGLIGDPYNSWANVQWEAGTTYLQRRGTTAYEQITIGDIGVVAKGTVTTGGTTTFTDTGETWTVDEFVGLKIRNNTDGSIGFITANTADTITAELEGSASPVWAVSDTYTVINPIVIGAYGEGPKPIIDCENTRKSGIYCSGAEYIEIYDFVVRNTYYENAADSKEQGAIFLSQTATESLNGCKAIRCDIEDAGWHGIHFVGNRGETSFLNCVEAYIGYCTATNCGGAGIAMRIKTTGGCIQEYNRAYACGVGVSSTQWGVYAAPYAEKIDSWTQWDNGGSGGGGEGTIGTWRFQILNGFDNNQPIEQAFAIGRTTAGDVQLTEGGSATTLGTDEFFWGTPYVYVNLGGESMTTTGVVVQFAEAFGYIQRYNHVEHTGGSDGVGIGTDQAAGRCQIYDNYSKNNSVGVSSHISFGNQVFGNVCIDNSEDGIRAQHTFEHASYTGERNVISNNLIYGSTDGIQLRDSDALELVDNTISGETNVINVTQDVVGASFKYIGPKQYSKTKTTAYTITSDEAYSRGLVFNNLGAGASVTLTLPAAVAGMEVVVERISTQSLIVAADSGESVYDSAQTAYVSVTLGSNQALVVLKCVKDGDWTTVAKQGTLTYNT